MVVTGTNLLSYQVVFEGVKKISSCRRKHLDCRVCSKIPTSCSVVPGQFLVRDEGHDHGERVPLLIYQALDLSIIKQYVTAFSVERWFREGELRGTL